MIPLDGSSHAEHAIPWALALAGEGAQLSLVHVFIPPSPVLVEGVVVADAGMEGSLREQEKSYLQALADRVRANFPHMEVLTETVDSDDPLPDALANLAESSEAELVIMTTHGRGPLARFLLGSITDDTIRLSPVPVLVVRGHEEKPADLLAAPVPNGLLIPLDGGTLAEGILPSASQFAKAFHTPVSLLMSTHEAEVEAVAPPEGFQPVTETKNAEIYLDRIARGLTEKGVQVAEQLITSGGDPATVILDQAALKPGQAVAIATHGRTGLSWFFQGSVADSVIHGAEGPVLVYRPPVADSSADNEQ